MAEIALAELAVKCNAQLIGDGNRMISSARPLQDAVAGCLTLIDHASKLAQFHESPAVAAVSPQAFDGHQKPLLVSDDPHRVFVEAILHFRRPRKQPVHGIHPAAVIDPSATIGTDTCIGPGVVIGPEVSIGARCVIHAGCQIQAGCRIGDDCQLMPNVVMYPETIVGHRVVLHAGVVLGGNGFGYRQQDGRHVSAPQLGWVEIDDDVEIGACTTIDRGTYGATRIGKGTKIDNLVQIGHNCHIGRHNLICAQVGLAGSCHTGDYVVLAGQVGVADHVTIHDGAVVGARSGIMRDIPANDVVLGAPALPIKQAMQVNAHLARLPQLRQSVRKLEQQIQKLLEQESDHSRQRDAA